MMSESGCSDPHRPYKPTAAERDSSDANALKNAPNRIAMRTGMFTYIAIRTFPFFDALGYAYFRLRRGHGDIFSSRLMAMRMLNSLEAIRKGVRPCARRSLGKGEMM